MYISGIYDFLSRLDEKTVTMKWHSEELYRKYKHLEHITASGLKEKYGVFFIYK